MTTSTVAFSDLDDSHQAGTDLGTRIREALGDEPPDALILFASARHDYKALLEAIDQTCSPKVMVGCSSAGEFITDRAGEFAVSAVALRSSDIRFAAGIGRGLRSNRDRAAADLVSTFDGVDSAPELYHAALVLNDPLSGGGDDLIEALTMRTGGSYRFFGGGAGDDARFMSTHVFHGTEAVTDAAVGLEMLSRRPIGIGVRHGWQPASRPMRVTEADGMRLVGLDGSPAVEVIEEHAENTGQHFDRKDPLSFFLHNTIGVEQGDAFKLRVPLAILDDGSIQCAAEIPMGSRICIMRSTAASAADAAQGATEAALEQLEGGTPEVALFFDCVATRLRLGAEFGAELETLASRLGSARYAGCNTYGQIARVPGQFSGFHNCTAVVCVIPT